jgi:putative ABC transport system permease protein
VLRAATAPLGQRLFVRSNRALLEQSLIVFDRTFAVTDALWLLTVLVAFVGVLSALLALELERGRELAVLRAGGLTPGQLFVLMTSHTALLGLAAGLIALPLGLGLAWALVNVINLRSFGWTLQFEVPAMLLVQAVGFAVLAAVLAGLWPAWRMGRTSVALSLRDE